MKTTTLIFTLLLGWLFSYGQAAYSTNGTIEYEKSVNSYALIKKILGKDPAALDQQKFEQYKKTQPQFKVLKSTLVFGNNISLFTPLPSEVNMFPLFTIPMTEQNNLIFTDLNTHKSIEQKDINGQFFLVKDSIRKIKWRITDETREIAGYTCRRANALILDSVYVVAFYTDDIHFSGGPEWFGGLPGMILELALPHDNVIWRAVKVTHEPAVPLMPPSKGKTINNKELDELLKNLLKNKPGQEQSIKALML